MSEGFKLTICQGKYEYRYKDGQQQVFRNGEPWAAMNDNLVGNKFVYSLAVELDEANKKVERLKAELAEKQRLNETLQQGIDTITAAKCDELRSQQAAVPVLWVKPGIGAGEGLVIDNVSVDPVEDWVALAAAPQPSQQEPSCNHNCNQGRNCTCQKT